MCIYYLVLLVLSSAVFSHLTSCCAASFWLYKNFPFPLSLCKTHSSLNTDPKWIIDKALLCQSMMSLLLWMPSVFSIDFLPTYTLLNWYWASCVYRLYTHKWTKSFSKMRMFLYLPQPSLINKTCMSLASLCIYTFKKHALCPYHLQDWSFWEYKRKHELCLSL